MKNNIKGNTLIYILIIVNLALVIGYMIFSNTERLSNSISGSEISMHYQDKLQSIAHKRYRLLKQVNQDGGSFRDTLSCPNEVVINYSNPSDPSNDFNFTLVSKYGYLSDLPIFEHLKGTSWTELKFMNLNASDEDKLISFDLDINDSNLDYIWDKPHCIINDSNQYGLIIFNKENTSFESFIFADYGKYSLIENNGVFTLDNGPQNYGVSITGLLSDSIDDDVNDDNFISDILDENNNKLDIHDNDEFHKTGIYSIIAPKVEENIYFIDEELINLLGELQNKSFKIITELENPQFKVISPLENININYDFEIIKFDKDLKKLDSEIRSNINSHIYITNYEFDFDLYNYAFYIKNNDSTPLKYYFTVGNQKQPVYLNASDESSNIYSKMYINHLLKESGRFIKIDKTFIFEL